MGRGKGSRLGSPCKISLGVFRVRICVRRMFQNLLKPEQTGKDEETRIHRFQIVKYFEEARKLVVLSENPRVHSSILCLDISRRLETGGYRICGSPSYLLSDN